MKINLKNNYGQESDFEIVDNGRYLFIVERANYAAGDGWDRLSIGAKVLDLGKWHKCWVWFSIFLDNKSNKKLRSFLKAAAPHLTEFSGEADELAELLVGAKFGAWHERGEKFSDLSEFTPYEEEQEDDILG